VYGVELTELPTPHAEQKTEQIGLLFSPYFLNVLVSSHPAAKQMRNTAINVSYRSFMSCENAPTRRSQMIKLTCCKSPKKRKRKRG
jgi:hypothetical protein